MSTYKRKPLWALELEARAELAAQSHKRELERQKRERGERAIADAFLFLSTGSVPQLPRSPSPRLSQPSSLGEKIIWAIVGACAMAALYALWELFRP
jgi:hypothetical protein